MQQRHFYKQHIFARLTMMKTSERRDELISKIQRCESQKKVIVWCITKNISSVNINIYDIFNIRSKIVFLLYFTIVDISSLSLVGRHMENCSRERGKRIVTGEKRERDEEELL